MSLFPASDTIVAIATPPGRGALAVVRVSGPEALSIGAALVRPWPIEAGQVQWAAVRDAAGTVLDRPVVTVYRAPRSYTGEDVIELTTHGGAIVPAAVVAACIAAGARLADRGEFTRRAVLNGKLDLAQAEAVGDLIDARTSAMHRTARAQLDGRLSARIRMLRDAVLHVEALIAYDIDFPDEDDGPVSRSRIQHAAADAASLVDELLATAPAGELMRTGATVVIAGPPNVGKSSLFNALLGRARALVSEYPGTTRDAVDATIEPDGAPFPLHLIDTAGLRTSADPLERMGIEVSVQAVGTAHIVLACGTTPGEIGETVSVVRTYTEAPILGVWTKRDALDSITLTPELAVPVVAVSAVTARGLAALVQMIVDIVGARWGVPDPDAPIVTRTRQRAALERAASELRDFRCVWERDAAPAVVAAVHLRAAAVALEEMIGAIDIDDVLDRVFAEFCIGK